ncbi:MAG: NADPH-dependent FMN reductase [Candidatus Methylacidiphilales bacterium]|nr:NAD(P)H-dependent oxidoreductase [Candidatus Methylacidiphilales bacterium]
MKILIISTSLKAASNSRIMSKYAYDLVAQRGVEVAFMDLRDHPLPLCDGGPCYSLPEVEAATKIVSEADAIIMGAPVYTYDLSAAAKNLIELTGSAWEDKVVAFLCAAGGLSSYMSVMSFANSLMLDFRCLIVPRFVYATRKAFEHDAVVDVEMQERIQQLVATTLRLAAVPK